MREIKSTRGLKSVERNKKRFRTISESLQNERLINESCKENEMDTYEMEKVVGHSKARTLKERQKCKNNKNKNKSNKVKKDMLCEAISYLAFDSLLLDEEYKDENKDRIISTYKENLEALMENGLLETKGCVLYEEYIAPVVNSFEDIDSNIEEPEKVIMRVQTVEKELVNESYFTLTESISKKVATVVKEEKALSKNRNLLQETFKKKYDGTSLFSNLNLYNFKEAKKLAIENDADVDLEKDKETLNKILDEALSETLIDYTFLETLNSCELLKDKNGMIANKIKKQISRLM